MSTYDIWLEAPYQDHAEREARREDWIEERALEFMGRLATDKALRGLATDWLQDTMADGHHADVLYDVIGAYAEREAAAVGHELHKVMRDPLWQWAQERAEKEWQKEHA